MVDPVSQKTIYAKTPSPAGSVDTAHVSVRPLDHTRPVTVVTDNASRDAFSGHIGPPTRTLGVETHMVVNIPSRSTLHV